MIYNKLVFKYFLIKKLKNYNAISTLKINNLIYATDLLHNNSQSKYAYIWKLANIRILLSSTKSVTNYTISKRNQFSFLNIVSNNLVLDTFPAGIKNIYSNE